MNIDYALLREQKEYLLTVLTKPLDSKTRNGLVHLLDALQDEAVETGAATPQEVFGPDEERDL